MTLCVPVYALDIDPSSWSFEPLPTDIPIIPGYNSSDSLISDDISSFSDTAGSFRDFTVSGHATFYGHVAAADTVDDFGNNGNEWSFRAGSSSVVNGSASGGTLNFSEASSPNEAGPGRLSVEFSQPDGYFEETFSFVNPISLSNPDALTLSLIYRSSFRIYGTAFLGSVEKGLKIIPSNQVISIGLNLKKSSPFDYVTVYPSLWHDVSLSVSSGGFTDIDFDQFLLNYENLSDYDGYIVESFTIRYSVPSVSLVWGDDISRLVASFYHAPITTLDVSLQVSGGGSSGLIQIIVDAITSIVDFITDIPGFIVRLVIPDVDMLSSYLDGLSERMLGQNNIFSQLVGLLTGFSHDILDPVLSDVPPSLGSFDGYTFNFGVFPGFDDADVVIIPPVDFDASAAPATPILQIVQPFIAVVLGVSVLISVIHTCYWLFSGVMSILIDGNDNPTSMLYNWLGRPLTYFGGCPSGVVDLVEGVDYISGDD